VNDDKILALYLERSEQAIAETEKVYGRYCHYIAYTILRCDEDAEEIVNDTWLKAWQVIPPQKPNPLKGFLGQITRRLSINRLELLTAQKRGGGQYALTLEELAECIPSNHNGEEIPHMAALTDTLNRFLRGLSADARRVFIRRYWYASSVSEISKDFSMSESKVKSMLLRTRKKLRNTLEKEGYDL